ncbi:MAG: TonB-dependent receptor, partial [Candidatus Eremiobacteraeota bacterium]|nr:TonB-dependent receptor [Candidatus Eremiobacteraeota bacterium]
MRLLLFRATLALIALAFVQDAAFAQPTDQATRVSGRVTSIQGAPIAGAQVVFSKETRFTRVIAAQDGTFTATLAPGEYHLSASALGFRPIARDVAVESASLSLSLQLMAASESLIEIGRVGVNSAPALSTSSNVTVELNPQAAAQRGTQNVGDIVAQEVGVTSVRPNGGGATLPFSVALRGPDPSETLVEIDGHIVNNSNTGDFNLSLLDPNDLSGIELLYGIAPSSLMGPNTIGGAINLRTLEPTAEPHALIRASAGSFNTFASTVDATGTVNRLGYAFSLHRFTSQGNLYDRTVAVSDDNGNVTPVA